MAIPRYLTKSSPWQLRLGERRAVLLFGDILVGLASLAITIYIWDFRTPFLDFDMEFLRTRVPWWFWALPLIWLVLLVEMYDVHRSGDWQRTVRGVLASGAIGFGLYVMFYFAYSDPRNAQPRLSVAIFLVAVTILTLAWRGLYIRAFTAPHFMRRVLLVGGGKSGELLLKIINNLWPPPFFLVGIIDDDPQKKGSTIDNVPVIGTSEHLRDIVSEKNVSDVIVAISGEMQGCMFQALLDVQECGVEITRMPVAYEELLGRVPIRLLEADWLLRSFVDQARVNAFYELGKRLIDIVGGLVGILIMLPILPFVLVAIVVDDGFPIFYAQMRSGRGGKPYKIIKFRTMRRDAEADGKPKWAKEDDERATRVGHFLRKTHLDELPQFLNVLRGEMSLVGPRAERPELVDMFQRHVPFYRARLLVKPGITGWAQVNFGYASTIEETIVKLEYDLYYIKHRSIFTDLLILLRTPMTVLGFRGR